MYAVVSEGLIVINLLLLEAVNSKVMFALHGHAVRPMGIIRNKEHSKLFYSRDYSAIYTQTRSPFCMFLMREA